jgi:hypothetical protein
MYLSSNPIRTRLDFGMIKWFNTNESTVIKVAPIMYGLKILLKLVPLDKIATNSVLAAIFDVKKITEMKVKRGLNKLP